MIDVDHNIKARLQWIKTVDSHEFGNPVLNTTMEEMEISKMKNKLEYKKAALEVRFELVTQSKLTM